MNDLILITAALSRALHVRDQTTAAHSTRTRDLARALGAANGFDGRDLGLLELAAELHDVGKIGIPDHILLKPGPLDEAEMALMRTHSRIGHDILMSTPQEGMDEVAEIVLAHHECMDGSGYPYGLCGADIPLPARIIAIVDSYDAMASLRPYHAPLSHEQIMRVMLDVQCDRYDPALLEDFAGIIRHSPHRARHL